VCGRFAQPRSADELARIFRARAATELAGERYNVAPTDPLVAIIERHGERIADEFRWGLVPWFAADRKGAARLINARSETVETSPAFRASFRGQRCIVPADAFYEWTRHRHPTSGRVLRSEPFAVRSLNGQPLAFAGLWATWRDPATAARLYTATIVTGPPNELVARVHDRMPIMLDPDGWDAWLAEETPVTELRALLRPAPVDGLTLYPVSTAVNNARSEGRELLLPLTRWTEPAT
jgi:putative SOS response-associated peptidase YedK